MKTLCLHCNNIHATIDVEPCKSCENGSNFEYNSDDNNNQTDFGLDEEMFINNG